MLNPEPLVPANREDREKLMLHVNDLAEQFLTLSAPNSAAVVLLAAQTCLAFRAAAAQMPLQDLMDNLLANLPTMYGAATQATKAVVVLDKG
jgi:predicted aconitase with swiveling domain